MKKLLSLLFLSSLLYSINPQWLWQHPIPPVSHFSSIEMLDNNTIIGAGGESMIMKSTDARIFTWPEEMSFTDQYTGWLFGLIKPEVK